VTVPIWIALLHHPVLNREGRVVTTAVTNLDLHDIARAARTFGATGYFAVTPIARQRELIDRIVEHWVHGHGAERVPERAEAMRLLATVATLEEAIAAVSERAGAPPWTVATCARPGRATVSFSEVRRRLGDGRPLVLLLGTGWGLADTALAAAEDVLEPISAPGSGYNHLSVRSAAAILLDRLLVPSRGES
jgi:hypothetical protein